MRMVGIEDAEFSSIIQLVAALLHVGNITFKKQGSKDAAEILDAEAHAVSAKLLGVSQSDLATALVKKNIQRCLTAPTAFALSCISRPLQCNGDNCGRAQR